MSIATELTKLRNNKDAIKAAITTKTGTDAGDDMSTYATKISGISGGDDAKSDIFKVRNGETDTYAPTVVPAYTDSMFSGLGASLKHVDFSKLSSIHIGSYMFNGCTWLNDIKVGDCEITGIGDYAFSDCRYGNAVNVFDFSNFTGTWIGQYAFRLTKAMPSVLDLSVCPNLTGLGNYAFTYNAFNSVKLPSTLTTLGQGCFASSYNLTNINIPDGVSNIPKGCFDYAYNLVVINFGNTRTIIPSLSSTNAFDRGDNTNRKIIVPDALYDDWIQATNWNSTTNNIVGSIIKYSDAVAQGIITE